MNLTVGTTLSAEHVADLTHDIVWMQSEVVDGQTVLVPVVYLAQASGRLGPTGAPQARPARPQPDRHEALLIKI
ncbi:hypothetical protein SFA35_16655 [Pseudomonas sp. HR96]|nr:hypothetical protein [Pseudomonas sp. HR96]WPO98271.1 hypothetical protein SFA35_16655 [Pseudomonas sp. HR96]